jgi:hypothetical protein
MNAPMNEVVAGGPILIDRLGVMPLRRLGRTPA